MQDKLEIYNRDDLIRLSDLVFSDPDYLDVKLRSDVRLDPKRDWTPVGQYDHTFKGCFDGCGHTISGLRDSLFGDVTGTVKNVTVEGEICNEKLSDNIYTAGLAKNVIIGKILNCTNRVKCSGHHTVAGLCGSVSGVEIDGCVNEADIIGPTGSGIVGMYCDEILVGPHRRPTTTANCVNKGNIILRSTSSYGSRKYYELPTLSRLQNNKFRYDQIGCKGSNNKQLGKVILPFQLSLLGMYLKYYAFPEPDDFVKRVMAEFIASDPDKQYLDSKSNTYLHLLCQNRDIAQTTLRDLILLLAERTDIDFAAVNKNGKTAETFLTNAKTGKPHQCREPLIELIQTIKKEKAAQIQEEEDETFSEIGF